MIIDQRLIIYSLIHASCTVCLEKNAHIFHFENRRDLAEILLKNGIKHLSITTSGECLRSE